MSATIEINKGETALWYASGKWAVHPLAPDTKDPLTKHGYKDASCDPTVITPWWEQWPDANIGLACGASGLILIDFDPLHYTDETRALLADLLDNHPTSTQSTPTDGRHLYYKLPSDVTLDNSKGSLPPGIDVKVNGYGVLAPSAVTYCGADAIRKGVPDRYHGCYKWLPGRNPKDCPPKLLPSKLLDLLRPAQPQPRVQTEHTAHFSVNGNGANPRYANKVIQGALDDLANCPVGKRSTTVYATAARLGELVVQGYLTETDVETHVLEAANRCGILQVDGEMETRKAIRNGLRKGMSDPKAVPAPQSKELDEELEIMVRETAARKQETAHILTEYTNGNGHSVSISSMLPVIQELPAIAYDDDSATEEPHPLDIQVKKGLQLGWVDAYADLMTHMTGAPREFNVLAGLVVAATVIQRRARLRMAFGDIYPNMYGAVIAPSSVYHKSSALAKPRAILQRAMLDKLLLSELFTSEGLLKQLQGQSSGLALRDEIGTLFASHNTKYLATLKPDLTALFDCYPYSRRLSNDEIKVQSPYLNILGATTPTRFFEGISHVDWQDGFLARWLFVMPEKEPDFDAMTGLYTNEHDASVGNLAVTLVNVDRQQETDFTLHPGAFDLWDDWQRQAAKDAYYYGDDVTAAIVTRYAAYALKFATILSAIHGSWGTITPATMQTAMDLADSFKATVYKLLTAKANYGVSGSKLQKIFKVIKAKAGIDGITQREIGRICSMKKGELTPCMEKLVSIGAVISTENGKTERFTAAVDNLPAKAW